MARPKLAPSSSHWRSALLAAPARVRLEQTISQSNHMEGNPEAPRRNYATSGMQRVNPNLCLRQRVPGVRARANLDRRLAVLPPSARPSSVRRRPGSSSPPQEKILKTYILLHSITFYYILLHFITFYYILLHFITFYYILLHFITFYYILLHFITFYYILLHFITFYYIFESILGI